MTIQDEYEESNDLESLSEWKRALINDYPDLIRYWKGEFITWKRRAYTDLSGKDMEYITNKFWKENHIDIRHAGYAITILMDRYKELEERISKLEQ